MAQDVKYDAFISYKHCEPDREIVERLHKKLENFRFPKDVAKKIGRSRLNRVFRDEAELAVSDDLSEEIEKALKNSEYLIAVCSPEYLQSVWCMKEIETFLKISDRRHILLVLANGEPETAFPEILLYDVVTQTDQEGRVIRQKKPREPLAADCRGENTKERRELIDKAVVRLVAAICGVGYDDLMQRQRKEISAKRTRRNLTAFGILFAILMVSLLFLIKISNQNAEIRQRYSDTLAATSVSLLKEGRRMDALYAARIALPEKKNKSFSENATQALTAALGIYNPPGTLSSSKDIMLPCSVADYTVSPNGTYLAVRGLDGLRYVINNQTGELMQVFDVDEFCEIKFNGEKGCIMKGKEENYVYYNLETLEETDLGINEAEVSADEYGNGFALITDEKIEIYTDEKCIFSAPLNTLPLSMVPTRFDINVQFGADGKEAFLFVIDFDAGVSNVLAVSLENGTLRSVPTFRAEGVYFDVKTDGKQIVWYEFDNYNYSVCRQSVEDASDYSRLVMPGEIYGVGLHGNDIVAFGRSIYLMDLSLSEYENISPKEAVLWGRSGKDGILLFEDKGGVHVIRDGADTFFSADIETSTYIMDDFKNGVFYVCTAGENHISTFAASETKFMVPYEGETDNLPLHVDSSPEEEEFLARVMGTESELDESRVYLARLCVGSDIGIVQLWDGVVIFYDSKTAKRLKTIYSLEGFIYYFYYDSARELYYVDADCVEVFDKDLKHLYSLTDSHFDGISPDGYPVVTVWRDEFMTNYKVYPATYEELMKMSDSLLVGYEPDERVKEKYSLE